MKDAIILRDILSQYNNIIVSIEFSTSVPRVPRGLDGVRSRNTISRIDYTINTV
jgi:hypothetical protein